MYRRRLGLGPDDKPLIANVVDAVKTCRQTQISLTVVPQTPEEERRFGAALDLFLAELVRQQIDRRKGTNEISETQGKELHRPGPL